MLTVAVDTYATVAEADAFIAARYVLTSVGAYWDALETDQKEGLMREALLHIDSLPLRGGRQHPYQPLAFPRFAMAVRPLPNPSDIPPTIKQAQVAEAVAILGERLNLPCDGKRLKSRAAEQLLRQWIPTALKGVL